jgi:hypothetical protein
MYTQYEFKVTCSYDGELSHWERTYTSALEAVESFNTFVDHGMASEYSTVNLYEPTGKCHTRIFRRGKAMVER